MITSTEERHVRVVMKMRLAQKYTSFHAISHGEQEVDVTVGCRWQQRAGFLRRQVLPSFQDNILRDIITN